MRSNQVGAKESFRQASSTIAVAAAREYAVYCTDARALFFVAASDRSRVSFASQAARKEEPQMFSFAFSLRWRIFHECPKHPSHACARGRHRNRPGLGRAGPERRHGEHAQRQARLPLRRHPRNLLRRHRPFGARQSCGAGPAYAGLGKTGLLAGAAPGFVNPLAPTPVELRHRAIWTNYRAVLDITAAGGYGTLYGPNVDTNGNVTSSEGKIPGCEHIAYADDGSGKKNVTLMVQVPDTFDSRHSCIVTAHSSGSRGVYGAIGASGEWGLKHGCVVAYDDKGTGNGLHDLETNVVGLIDGTHTTANVAGTNSHFTANLTAASVRRITPRSPIGSPSSTHIRSRTPSMIGARTRCSRSCSPSMC